MNKEELLKNIESDHITNIFAKIYGEGGVNTALRRYKKLITEMAKNSFDCFCETENLHIFSAPGRTELAGNHTDHNHGKVLAASIHLDSAAIVQKRDDNTVFFRSTGYPDVKVKLTDSSGAFDSQQKPEETGKTHALVRGIAAELNRRVKNQHGFTIGGFSANVNSMVLPGLGLSSSAAIEVLLGRIFDSLYGEGKRSPLEIAQIGQIAENIYFGKPCGLMDQIACASGGAVAIDFSDTVNPEIKQINFDPAAAGYALCAVNTGGSHADLTGDYASIPAEMKNIAAFFGKSVLGELQKETILANAKEIRKKFGDRAFLRSIHFYDENIRVDKMTSLLTEMNKADSSTEKQKIFSIYLDIVNESGDSSWKLLQNVYTPHHPQTQGISVALTLTKNLLEKQKLHGACRIHGGGFAGAIQAYIPIDAMDIYRVKIEAVFGAGSVTVLQIRQTGAVKLL